MLQFCDFNDNGGMICDIVISRPDVSRRLTKRFNRFCENDTDEEEREIEIEREKKRSASSRLLRRHRVYRGTRVHRVSL